MQLAVRSFGQMHLCSREIGAGGEIGDDLLTDPAASKDSRFRVGEAPFQVRHGAIVSRLGTEVVWVGPIDLVVGSALGDGQDWGSNGAGERSLEMMAPLPFPSIGWPKLNC